MSLPKYSTLTVVGVTMRPRTSDDDPFGTADHALHHRPDPQTGDIVLDDVLQLQNPTGVLALDLGLARQALSEAHKQLHELHILADGEAEHRAVTSAIGRLRMPLDPTLTRVFRRHRYSDVEPWVEAD